MRFFADRNMMCFWCNQRLLLARPIYARAGTYLVLPLEIEGLEDAGLLGNDGNAHSNALHVAI